MLDTFNELAGLVYGSLNYLQICALMLMAWTDKTMKATCPCSRENRKPTSFYLCLYFEASAVFTVISWCRFGNAHMGQYGRGPRLQPALHFKSTLHGFDVSPATRLVFACRAWSFAVLSRVVRVSVFSSPPYVNGFNFMEMR